MRQINIFSLYILILFLIPSEAYCQTVSGAKGLAISPDALRTELRTAGETAQDLDILIYGYTPPAEAYTLSPDGTLSVKIKPGELRALVRKVSSGEMKKAVFVSGTGTDEASILKSLADAIVRLRIE